MSPTDFHIVLQLKTRDGFEPFGRFVLGSDREFAEELFRHLKGNVECSDRDLLQIDLVEVNGSLPQQMKMMSCCLEDIAENCRIITRELFRKNSLER